MKRTNEIQEEPRKSSKKIGVVLSGELDQELSLELISILYEDAEVEPVSFEQAIPEDDGLLQLEDVVSPYIINASSEIISPLIRLFDGDIFVLNYQKYY
ncbi:MAG: hypothetical protein FJZ57_07975 [Chlamydiae bacterium]|nr:hypothetical protein [Chlamydiota bacterium]